MALLDLDVVKGHLRVFHDDEDMMVAVYQAAAEDAIVNYLDRPVFDTNTVLPGEEDEGYDATAIIITPSITAAILLHAAELFERREPPEKNEGEAMLSPSIRRLLAPYRVWRRFEEDPVLQEYV